MDKTELVKRLVAYVGAGDITRGTTTILRRDLTDAIRLTQEKMDIIEQLTAANEKLAAARERDLRLVEWLCCLLDEVKPDDATKAQAVKFLDAFNTGDGNKNP